MVIKKKSIKKEKPNDNDIDLLSKDDIIKKVVERLNLKNKISIEGLKQFKKEELLKMLPDPKEEKVIYINTPQEYHNDLKMFRKIVIDKLDMKWYQKIWVSLKFRIKKKLDIIKNKIEYKQEKAFLKKMNIEKKLKQKKLNKVNKVKTKINKKVA